MMFKSLVLVSLFALGASAQTFPGLGSIPSECQDKCKEAASLGSKCTSMDGACLSDICASADKFKPCLECAKMSDIYTQFVSACSSLGHDVSDAAVSGAASSGAASVSQKSGPEASSSAGGATPAASSGAAAPATASSGASAAASSGAAPSSGDKAGAGALKVSIGAVAAGAVVAACF